MFDDFSADLTPRWTQTCIGGGSLFVVDSNLRMSFEVAYQGQYTDAQIDDYDRLPRSKFPWKPPLRMEVRARSSRPAASLTGSLQQAAALRGTAGFGFWNYPFSARGDILMLPEAIWFFYAAPPSNMALVPGVPGWGWKAQVVHSMRPAALAASVPLAVTAALGRISGDTRPASRWMQRLTGAQETLLDVDMSEWHTYVLEWFPDMASFWVDDTLVLRAPQPPTRPLGFVAWLDNQYAIATPRGDFHFGTVESGPQWLDLGSIRIDAW
ncbi:MAG TPA: hypothetical protein VNE38_07730 [Ktedonobacteraceae bacterium]|nr:hypothetical protein [Ktedonobacteraceae bacterium]